MSNDSLLDLYICFPSINVLHTACNNSVPDLGMDEGEDEPVPLPNVNAAILKKVIHWCTYHKDDAPMPEDDENKEKRTDDICSWDVEFLKVDQGTLFELILVGTYSAVHHKCTSIHLKITLTS